MAEVFKCPVKFFARAKKCPYFLVHGTWCTVLVEGDKSKVETLPTHCIKIVDAYLKEDQSLDELHAGVQTCTNFAQLCAEGSLIAEFYYNLEVLLKSTAQGFDASDW